MSHVCGILECVQDIISNTSIFDHFWSKTHSPMRGRSEIIKLSHDIWMRLSHYHNLRHPIF